MRARKAAPIRRVEILAAAAIEFAETGLAGTRLEAIAMRADISHSRIIQMFGTKQALFLEVVNAMFDKVLATFTEAADSAPGTAELAPLAALGGSYFAVLQRDRTISLLMLQAFAAAADPHIRTAVGIRYRALQTAVADLTGADTHQVRTFFAIGLTATVSMALALPDPQGDAQWGLNLVSHPSPQGTPLPKSG